MFGRLHPLRLEMRRVGMAFAWLCVWMTSGAAWGQFTDGINVEFGCALDLIDQPPTLFPTEDVVAVNDTIDTNSDPDFFTMWIDVNVSGLLLDGVGNHHAQHVWHISDRQDIAIQLLGVVAFHGRFFLLIFQFCQSLV